MSQLQYSDGVASNIMNGCYSRKDELHAVKIAKYCQIVSPVDLLGGALDENWTGKSVR